MTDSDLCVVMIDRCDPSLIEARFAPIVDVFGRDARHATNLKKLDI